MPSKGGYIHLLFLLSGRRFSDCLKHLFPLVAECSHGGEEQIGSRVEQHLSVQGAGVDGDGKDSCGYAGLYADGGIFDHDGFVGCGVGFLKPHQIGLGIRLAQLDIKGRDHVRAVERVGIASGKPFKQ